MLLVLNRRALPDEIGLKGWRLPIIAVTALLFIGPLLFLLYQIITDPTSLAYERHSEARPGGFYELRLDRVLESLHGPGLMLMDVPELACLRASNAHELKI